MSNKIYTIGELKRKIGKILAEFPVEKAILFGSYAKGDATRRSDIDLVIDSNNQLIGLDFYEVKGTLEEKLKKEIDLIEISDIIKGQKADKEISRTGVVIYVK